MATVAQLAAQTFQDVGYVFMVEGWPIMWTNRHELAGSGGSSWIGDDTGVGEGRTVVLGLEVPSRVRLGIGLVDSGMPGNDGLTLTLVDRDDHLIAFAEDEEGDELWERLPASSSAAPATLLGPNSSNISIHGRWVNGEAIGSAGARRQYQILPLDPLPGADHASIGTSAGLAGLRASTVQTAARWMEGRPCALYVIRKDPTTGEWDNWETQYYSGYSLIWWGTVKGVPQAQAGAWKVECEGPSSWLRKPLNVNRPAEWKPLETYLSFGPGEDYIAVGLGFLPSQVDPAEMGAVSAFTASDQLTPGLTPTELANQIDARIQALAAIAGTDHTFSAYQDAKVTFDDSQVKIRINNNVDSPNGYPMSAVLQLRMHKSVWAHLGWDLVIQNGGLVLDGLYELEIEEADDHFSPLKGTNTDDPAPGYVGVRFSTRPPGWKADVNPSKADNEGDDRIYLPYIKNPGGGQTAISILQPEAKQELDIGYTEDAPYLEQQLAKPPADVTISSGTCDAAGFLAVRGTRVTEIDGDEETVYQLGRISWVDGGTYVAVDGLTSKAVVWCEEWLDIKQWGSTSEKLTAAWAANDLECVPVALLSYNLDAPDHAHRVLLRILTSSGTASWTGVGEAATLNYGDNANLAFTTKGNDLEIADLGLCIPEDLIDFASFASAAAALPGGKDGPLARTRLAYIGPFDSQQCIEDILRPRGWCFSLAGGRYGLFARNAPINIDDAVVELTQADVAGDPGELPPAETVDFRPLEPVDLVEVSYGESQIGGDGRDAKFVVQARDPRAMQRRGNAKVDIDGRTLLADGSWRSDFTKLWGEQLATWFGEPHMTVRVSVKGNVGRDIWPGSVVTYTSPWPATRNGVYGVDRRVGRVIAVETDTLTLAKHLEILVEGKDPLGQARFAPVARLLDDVTDSTDRHDDNLRTFYCYADAFGRDSDVSDVAAFVEPEWSDAGGNLRCAVWQSWDGVTWEETATFTVVTVDPTENTITYDDLNGTVWERRYAILLPRDYGDQQPGEWPIELFGVICDPDGTHDGGTPGRKWVLP